MDTATLQTALASQEPRHHTGLGLFSRLYTSPLPQISPQTFSKAGKEREQ